MKRAAARTAPKTHAATRARTAAKAPPTAPVRAVAASPVVARPVPVAKPTPVVDLAPVAPPPAPVAQSKPVINTDEALMFGAGALALLALAGTGVAVVRRRRRRDEWADDAVMAEEPMVEPAPVPAPAPAFQPTLVAPTASAFGWNSAPPRTAEAEPAPAGETWVERAQRGPTPDNPSLSLRKRLKRAAFFDQREADAAAGKAVAVDPDAGLPDSLDTRELEAA